MCVAHTGLHWPGIRSCCDKHDECYDTCGLVKKTCDQHFEDCLKQVCKRLRTSVLDLFNQGFHDEDIKNRLRIPDIHGAKFQ